MAFCPLNLYRKWLVKKIGAYYNQNKMRKMRTAYEKERQRSD